MSSADARNPKSRESEARYLRELQATQGYIELYPGLPYAKKKKKKRFYVSLQEGNTETQEISRHQVHSSAVAGTAQWEVLGVPAV